MTGRSAASTLPDMDSRPRSAAIIGCGIAGPLAALFLQRVGFAATVFEASDRVRDDEGAFLNLPPNGMNVLKLLELDGAVASAGTPIDGLTFHDRSGRQIGRVDSRADVERYGARQVVIRRGDLNRVLREAAIERGIEVHFGRRLTRLDPAGDRPTAHFADGSQSTASLIIGCDGVHSRTRRGLLPHAPAPAYTGLVDCGGVSATPDWPDTGLMRMTFGKRAFFGRLTAAGQTYWFSNSAQPTEPARDGFDDASGETHRGQLLEFHGEDPEPIPTIIRRAERIERWPIYDLASLPTWHRGHVCLLGDAAHAISPHAGQGAALAMEDACVLALSLRDAPTPRAALAAFERTRRPRVQSLIRQARRTGDRKVPSSALAVRARDVLLPVFLKLGQRSARSAYGFRVEWEGTT